MRIVITSDLHRFSANLSVLEQLAADIESQAPDLFVIAGNIGEPLSSFNQILSLFGNLNSLKALVTGTRDVWDKTGEVSSQYLWEEALPAAIADQGYLWLERENLIAKRIGICGSLAWYDYSGRDNSLGYSVDQYEELKGLVNNDAQYVNWPWSDRDFAAYLQEGFTPRLESLEESLDVDHVIVITHIPVFKEAIVHIGDDIRWRFGSAYSFNLNLGRTIVPKSKIRYVVSGHTQLSGEWEVSFGNNTFKMMVIGFDNRSPRYVTLEI